MVIVGYVNAQDATTSFSKQIATAAYSLQCKPPVETDPVSINAVLVKDNNSDSAAVIIKAELYPGWHIYAYVPPDKPYITTEQLLHLPQGVKAVGQWQKSPPQTLETDAGVFVYEVEAIFTQKMLVPKGSSGTIEAGLSYQTCDIHQCMPPVEKTVKLAF